MLLVRAPYYQGVVDGMTNGALRILGEAGATHTVLDVAGAFELPAGDPDRACAVRSASTASSPWGAWFVEKQTITTLSAAASMNGLDGRRACSTGSLSAPGC